MVAHETAGWSFLDATFFSPCAVLARVAATVHAQRNETISRAGEVSAFVGSTTKDGRMSFTKVPIQRMLTMQQANPINVLTCR